MWTNYTLKFHAPYDPHDCHISIIVKEIIQLSSKILVFIQFFPFF